MEEYRTIRGTASGEYEEKKSRFIAAAAHVETEAEAVAFLEQIRAANRTARHNVYAYKLRAGNRERYSDDGEPAKTAGTPVLEVIGHSGLTDLIVVVTRYFGGILLTLLIGAAGGKLADPVFTDRVSLEWQMRAGTQAPLLEQLRELTRGQGKVEVSDPFYGPI